MIRYTLFSLSLFFTPHQTTWEPHVPLYLAVFILSFSFFFIFFLNIIFRPYFAFPYPLLCFSLLLSSAIAYHFLSSSFFFFNVNTFKLHPSKQTSLNNITSTLMVYPRPAFIPGLFYFAHFALLFIFLIYIQQSSRLLWLLHLRNI